MHPLIAYDLAKYKMADLHAEAEHERMAKAARSAARKVDVEPREPVRWALRRLFAKLHLAGAGA